MTTETIASILRRYGIARDTYTIRSRYNRLPFDQYTVELMLTNRVDSAKVARCLRSSGIAVMEMSAVSLHVAA